LANVNVHMHILHHIGVWYKNSDVTDSFLLLTDVQFYTRMFVRSKVIQIYTSNFMINMILQ